MWTLSETKNRLSDRLGETSTVFWSEADRTYYINDAQRFIASVTRGVEETVTGPVSTSTPYLTLPAKVVSSHMSSGYVGGGDAISTVPIHVANATMPSWRTFQGATAKWAILDLEGRRAYFSPIPRVPKTIYLSVSVLPEDFATDGSDDASEVFNGSPVMERYQGSLIQLAAVYALLKERYDQEAEKYYQFFIQELQSLGVNPTDIPGFGEVRANAQSDS